MHSPLSTIISNLFLSKLSFFLFLVTLFLPLLAYLSFRTTLFPTSPLFFSFFALPFLDITACLILHLLLPSILPKCILLYQAIAPCLFLSLRSLPHLFARRSLQSTSPHFSVITLPLPAHYKSSLSFPFSFPSLVFRFSIKYIFSFRLLFTNLFSEIDILIFYRDRLLDIFPLFMTCHIFSFHLFFGDVLYPSSCSLYFPTF